MWKNSIYICGCKREPSGIKAIDELCVLTKLNAGAPCDEYNSCNSEDGLTCQEVNGANVCAKKEIEAGETCDGVYMTCESSLACSTTTKTCKKLLTYDENCMAANTMCDDAKNEVCDENDTKKCICKTGYKRSGNECVKEEENNTNSDESDESAFIKFKSFMIFIILGFIGF